MNIRNKIKSNLSRIEVNNAKNTEKYKKNLLDQLASNIDKATDKKKAVADNKGLIERYKHAKPRPLTQMQQALKEAIQ